MVTIYRIMVFTIPGKVRIAFGLLSFFSFGLVAYFGINCQVNQILLTTT